MEKLSNKKQFKAKPYINPKTGEVIKVGGKEYNKLVKLYGEPNKVKSPTSHKLISVNKIAYKQLIKSLYTDQEIFYNLPKTNKLSPNKVSPIKTSPTKSPQKIITLNDDVLGIIYSNINDIDTLASICSTNKSIGLMCNQATFWDPVFDYHNIPKVIRKNAGEYIKYIRKKLLPITLLKNPQPNREHQTFHYYDKEYMVPNIGDIIIVSFSNFDTYYILVTEVILGPGKDGTIYAGYSLREKGSTYLSVSSPAFLKSRNQLEPTGKYYKINPKDRRRVVSVAVSEL
jgi:hypothetical protein